MDESWFLSTCKKDTILRVEGGVWEWWECDYRSLTQLHVLVICQYEDNVGPDVAPVPLEAGLQALVGQEHGAVGESEEPQQQEAHR